MTRRRISIRGKAHRFATVVRGEIGTYDVTLTLNENYSKASPETQADVRTELRDLGPGVIRIGSSGEAQISESWLADFVDIEEVSDRDWRYDDGEVSVVNTDYRRGKLES